MRRLRNSVPAGRLTPAVLLFSALWTTDVTAQAGGAAAGTQPAPVAVPADAYADAAAREMVRLARIRRAMVDRRIEAYETTVVERISAGLGWQSLAVPHAAAQCPG